MKPKVILIFSVGIFLYCSGCYPEGPEFIEDVDLVATLHDPDFDFSTVGTYAIPDSVVKITGNLKEGDPIEFVRQIYATTIIESIKDNMNRNGWTEVDKGNNPDVIILPSAIRSTRIFYDWWYWGNEYWDW